MIKKTALIFLLFFIIVFSLFPEGENLTLKVAVMGPGDELYFWWGHIGLIIENSITGRNYLYDYGQFSFDQENFFYNFAFGRLYYNCGVQNADNFLRFNKMFNRDIVIYTLDVPAYKCQEILEFADNAVLPENCIYEYHHFNDNCSTRIRDIIDLITDGQFYEKFSQEIGRFTLREHVRRHTWFDAPIDWTLNFWMGQVIDTPITMWQEMFLPSEVGRNIENFYYVDRDGINRKLVTDKKNFNVSEGRPAVLESPVNNWPFILLFSLALSALLGFFFFLTAKKIRIGQAMAGISISLISLAFGIVSLVLYFLSLFTNHDYTFSNMNMIFCSPLLFIAVPYGFVYAFTKKPEKILRCSIVIRLIWLLTVAGILLTIILKLFPWFYQKNLPVIMLMLPIALVFSFQPVGLKDSLNEIKKLRIFRR